jgi:hypothetical protein
MMMLWISESIVEETNRFADLFFFLQTIPTAENFKTLKPKILK